MPLPSSGRIAMSDIWRELNSGSSGSPVVPEPTECDYYFTSRQDFDNRIEGILIENNQDLSTKTIGFSDDITNESELFVYTSEMIGLPKMIVGKNITNLTSLCSTNTSIKIVPETLLYGCPNLENFMSGFEKTNIETIPVGIFSQNPKLINLNYCFYDAYLTDISSNIFDNNPNLANVIYCFRNDYNVNTGTLPDVWNRNRFPNIDPSSVDGYAIGNEKCTNYDDCPVSYGGWVRINITSTNITTTPDTNGAGLSLELYEKSIASTNDEWVKIDEYSMISGEIINYSMKLSRHDMNYRIKCFSNIPRNYVFNGEANYNISGYVDDSLSSSDIYNANEDIEYKITFIDDHAGGTNRMNQSQHNGGGIGLLSEYTTTPINPTLPPGTDWVNLSNNSIDAPKSIAKSKPIPPKPISLGSAEFRKLAGVPTGPIKMSDFYGKPEANNHSCVFKWIPPWSDYKTYEKRVDVPDGSFVGDYTNIDFEQVKTDMGWPSRFVNYNTITIYDTNGKVLSGMDETSEIKQPIICENMLDADYFGYSISVEETSINKVDETITNDREIIFSSINDIFNKANTFWYPEDNGYLTDDLYYYRREITGEVSVSFDLIENTPITFPYSIRENATFLIHTKPTDKTTKYGELETSEYYDIGDEYTYTYYNIYFYSKDTDVNFNLYLEAPEAGDADLIINRITPSDEWIKNMKYCYVSALVEMEGFSELPEKVLLFKAKFDQVYSSTTVIFTIPRKDFDNAFYYKTDGSYVVPTGDKNRYRKFKNALIEFKNE